MSSASDEAAASSSPASSAILSATSSTAVAKSKRALSAHSPVFVPTRSPSYAPTLSTTTEMPTFTALGTSQYESAQSQPPAFNYSLMDVPAYTTGTPAGSSSLLHTLTHNTARSDQAVTEYDMMLHSVLGQVEFYFSNSNLWKDHFLRREISQTEEGWVNLNVLATFNKLKALNADAHTIRLALRMSKKLQLSDDGQSVRRISPLPLKNPKAELRRTIHVSNIPAGSTLDSLRDVFQASGPVAFVKFADTESEAWIEFEKNATVKKVLQELKTSPERFHGMLIKPKTSIVKQQQQLQQQQQPPQQPQHTTSSPVGQVNQPVPRPKVQLRDSMNWREMAKPGSSSPPLEAANSGDKDSSRNRRERKEKDKPPPFDLDKLEIGRPPKFASQRKAIVKVRMAKGPDGTKGFTARKLKIHHDGGAVSLAV